jgi:hypothetical protein
MLIRLPPVSWLSDGEVDAERRHGVTDSRRPYYAVVTDRPSDGRALGREPGRIDRARVGAVAAGKRRGDRRSAVVLVEHSDHRLLHDLLKRPSIILKACIILGYLWRNGGCDSYWK